MTYENPLDRLPSPEHFMGTQVVPSAESDGTQLRELVGDTYGVDPGPAPAGYVRLMYVCDDDVEYEVLLRWDDQTHFWMRSRKSLEEGWRFIGDRHPGRLLRRKLTEWGMYDPGNLQFVPRGAS